MAAHNLYLGKRGNPSLLTSLLVTTASMMFISVDLNAAEIYNARVDRENQIIIIQGTGFVPSTTVTLGGIEVPTANVVGTQLEIPFAAEVYSAVQWEGSYNLIIDGTERISVYIDAPIVAPPPPGGPDCPCTSGWNNAALLVDSFLCGEGTDGSQSYFYGNSFDGNNWFISTAFDSNNIVYDDNNPGNAISYCALVQGNNYTVSEPVVNQEQFDDCQNWIVNVGDVCLFY
jgi:hypothetical protein